MNNRDALDEATGRPSKSREKRRTRVLQGLVRQLVALPPAKLAGLPLEESLREAIESAKTMKRAALARQQRYLVGLMRGADADLIARELRQMSRPHRKAVQDFHRLEQWREGLIAGDDGLLDELVAGCAADRRHLQRLVRDARQERERGAAPRSSRLLFKYLAELQAGR